MEQNQLGDTQERVLIRALLRDLYRHRDQLASDKDRVDVEEMIQADLGGAALSVEDVINKLVNIGTLSELQPIIAQYGLRHPLYNYRRRFDENREGAWDAFPTDPVAATPPLWKLLGQDIGFPLGVPASPLTVSANWIDYFARKGFNVLTYKTVRSGPKEALHQPNWVFLEGLDKPVPIGSWPESVTGDVDTWPPSLSAFSTANSFGIPSLSPLEWQKDIEACLGRLRTGQCLIVSVTGNHDDFHGPELIKDFVNVAEMASETGTKAVELNLSCPNTVDHNSNGVKPPIFESAQTTLDIVRAVRDRLQSKVALVIKLGYLSRHRIEEIVSPLAKTREIDAVSGINTYPVEVRRRNGELTFGPDRATAGVSGAAIREHGIDFVSSLATIRREQALAFEIIGMGGVMNVEDIEAFLRAGADAVQTATGAFVDSSLPSQIQDRLGGPPASETELEARTQVLSLLKAGPLTLRQISEGIAEVVEPQWVVTEKTFRILRGMESEGLVASTRSNGRVVFDLSESSESATAGIG